MKRSLSSATQWLTSTATRLFSSSSESVQSAPATAKTTDHSGSQAKRSRGRPKKEATSANNSTRRNLTFSREIDTLKQVIQSRTRSSSHSSLTATGTASVAATSAPKDGQVRYLLTLKALPNHLRLIAQLLYPPPQDMYEEHRLACKLFAEEENSASVHREIFIPTFRRLPSSAQRPGRDSIRPGERESISDADCLQRHRPLELAERRERRREEELLRYEEYIRKLSREYPELLNRKYSFSASSSHSSIS